MKSQQTKFDLKERTSKFGKKIVTFARNIPQSPVTTSIIIQLVKSGTSVGANYCEADDAESRTDFKHKISICKKEARECKYWLNIVGVAIPKLKKEADLLAQEAKELNLIFNAIVKSTIRNSTK